MSIGNVLKGCITRNHGRGHPHARTVYSSDRSAYTMHPTLTKTCLISAGSASLPASCLNNTAVDAKALSVKTFESGGKRLYRKVPGTKLERRSRGDARTCAMVRV